MYALASEDIFDRNSPLKKWSLYLLPVVNAKQPIQINQTRDLPGLPLSICKLTHSLSDDKSVYAVIRVIEIIREPAKPIPDEAREMYSEVPSPMPRHPRLYAFGSFATSRSAAIIRK